MQAMTAAMIAQLQGSHVSAVKVEVLQDYDLLGTIDAPVGGSVTVERAAVERRGEVQFFDYTGTLTPVELTSLLSPGTGNNLRLWRGIKFPTGAPDELVPLVTGRIARSSGTFPNVTADLYDFAWVIGRARMEAPYTIAAGTNYVTAIQSLLTNRMTGVQVNFPTTSSVTPLIVIEEQADPWEQAQRMAESIGYRLYFDPLGIARMSSELGGADAVWSYQEGPNALILDLDLDLDVEGHYNAVIVTGENPANSTPVRAAAYNTDPTSPTRWDGPWGKVPMFYSSEFITTTEQATAAAKAMLQKQLGMDAQLTITGLVNPAHEIGDPIEVRRLASGVDAVHLLDNVTIPLQGATSTIQTRRQNVVSEV